MRNKTLYCFLESFLYATIVYFIFFHFSPFKYKFLEMNLHPLLIVVAIISLKYGTYMSSFVVSFSLFYYILAYMKLGRDLVLFFSTFEYYKFILMFFFTALFLGKLRDTSDEKIIHLENEVSNVKDDYNKQKENNVKLAKINSRLKKRIIGSRESIITLNQIRTSLDKMSVEEIYTEAALIIKQFIECEVVSIYSFNPEKNFMRLKLRVGKGRMPGFFQLNKYSVFNEVIEAGEPLEFPLDTDGNSPLYVSPITGDGKIMGFINIERMEFEAGERYSYEMFKIITHWLNEALSRAVIVEEMEIKENSLENTRIFNLEYFNKILKEEERRKKLLGMEFATFETKIKDISPKKVADIIEDKIRESDFVGMDDERMRVLFPATNYNETEILLEKLSEIFKDIEVDFYEI